MKPKKGPIMVGLAVFMVVILLALPAITTEVGLNIQEKVSKAGHTTARIDWTVDSPAKAVITATWNYKAYINGKLVEDPFVSGTYGSESSQNLGVFLILKWPSGGWQYNVFNMNGHDVKGWPCGLSPVIGTQYNIPNNITTFMVAGSSCNGNAIGWIARYKPCCHDYKRYAIYVPANVQAGLTYRVRFVDYGVDFQNTTNLDPSSYLFLIRPLGYTGNPTFALYDPNGNQISDTAETETWARISDNLAKVAFAVVYKGANPVQVKELRVTLNSYDYGRIIFKNPVTLTTGDSIDIRVDVILH